MPRLRKQKDTTCICFGQYPRIQASLNCSALTDKQNHRAMRVMCATQDQLNADHERRARIVEAAKWLEKGLLDHSTDALAEFLACGVRALEASRKWHEADAALLDARRGLSAKTLDAIDAAITTRPVTWGYQS